ncbi:MAG: Lon protease [Myxococcales bacterium]
MRSIDDVDHDFAAPLPVLPLRAGVLFPGTTLTIPVGRGRSRALVQAAIPGRTVVGIAVQRDPQVKDPGIADLHPLGTLAVIQRVQQAGEGRLSVVLEGIARFELQSLVQADPYWLGACSPVPDTSVDPLLARLLAESLRKQLRALDPDGSGTLAKAIGEDRPSEEPGRFADRVAAALGLDSDKEVMVLLAADGVERLRLVLRMAAESITTADLRRKIDAEVRKELSQGQREHVLRQQLKAIQKELGEDEQDELGRLRERLGSVELPDDVRRMVDRELKRLATLGAQQPEHNVVRTHLQWVADLPWNERAEADIAIDAVAAKLDADHYGLQDVKKRILEHMAVLKVTGHTRGTILCLVGPPGVGKTSLGQSIADATGRPFVRIALGGTRDEAEIRGHRRTYIGSIPGRIVHGLRTAKVKNPVMLLDEVDKLGRGWAGDPEAALLEVLDPEQNKHFVDHYLEVPFDLSEVLFICTANTVDSLSPPLRDRLEIVEISGYTHEEKQHIARGHLIPKRVAEHGIPDGAFDLTDDALRAVIRDYTREAGVRQLDRQLTKLCRSVTLRIARQDDAKPEVFRIDAGDLLPALGKVRFQSEVAERTAVPGVAIGLAWTPVGGDILFIETSRMPGKGHVEITGQLGDVMKESARAAMTYVRSHAGTLGVDPAFLEGQDVHIHVPAGAVPKDGPSAGVTIFTALASLLTGRRVRSDTAMTGECTLRGRVLPVGGIKAKVLAAHRAGITQIILPRRNERDLDEVPEDVRSTLEFVLVEDMAQVLAAALEDPGAPEGRDLAPEESVAVAKVTGA